jgi:phenylacetate-coenzyme A ligase PaaK-like adenylate-forming protein
MENRQWGFSNDYFSSSLKILDTALAQVAAYRAWRAFDPGPRFPVDERFAAMPALTKKDIRDNFPQGMVPEGRDINKGLASDEIQFVETSGTTDDKVTNFWNQRWWDASERGSW